MRPDVEPEHCPCIRLMNESLAQDGQPAMVDTSMVWSGATDTKSIRIHIGCVKTDPRSRKRTPVLIAQFCPLCGTSYKDTAARPPAEGGV